jgi:hypothetical protein
MARRPDRVLAAAMKRLKDIPGLRSRLFDSW